MLPYSREVLFSLFGQLNSDFAIAQLLALACALAIAFQLWRPRPPRIRLSLVLLSALWLGCSYFWFYRILTEVNFLAPVYTALAGAQALGLMIAIVVLDPDDAPPNRAGSTVLALLALAWPLVDLLTGPGWPLVRLTGLTAAPLLLLTLAVLLQLPPRQSIVLGVLPLLLSSVCAYEAYVLTIAQNWLPLLGCTAVAALQLRTKATSCPIKSSSSP